MAGREKRRQDPAPADEQAAVNEPGADLAANPDMPAGQIETRAGDGRPKCTVDDCPLPEFMDGVGLCGGHWATRPDLRKGARRGQ